MKRLLQVLIGGIILLSSSMVFGDSWTRHDVVQGWTVPFGVSVGDFNGDSRPDFVVSDHSPEKYVWFEHNGQTPPGFNQHNIAGPYSYGGFKEVLAVDVDGNGTMDFLSASDEWSDLTWWDNNGSGSFTQRTIDGNMYYADNLDAADINGDGDIDIIASGPQSTAWYEQTSTGVFTKHTLVSGQSRPYQVVFAELTGDTHMDLVLGDIPAQGYRVWENDGAENFTEVEVISGVDGPGPALVIDVNDDGHLDIVGRSFTADFIAWWENDGNNHFPTKHTIVSGFDAPSYLLAVDIDGDSDLDIVADAYYTGGVRWWANDGNGNFSGGMGNEIDFAFPDAKYLNAADFDDDGDQDIVAAGDGGISWWENPRFGGEPRGLIAHWNFNEGSGNVLTDISGYGHHGTIYGAPQWVSGVEGDALQFDGIDDYVDIQNVGDFRFNNQSLTFTAWVQVVDNANISRLFVSLGSMDVSFTYPAINLSKSRSGHLDGRFHSQVVGSGGTHIYSLTSGLETGDEIAKNTWIHLAGVVDHENSLLRLYVNGQQEDTDPLVSFDLSSLPSLALFLGRQATAGDYGYHYGLLDEVRIYDEALSGEEVDELYHQHKPGGGLIAHWTFDEGQGSTVIDQSEHGNDGIVMNGATWSNEAISGTALQFDGTDDYVQINNPVVSTPPYTICAWIKPSAVEDGYNHYIVANGAEETGYHGVALYLEYYVVNTGLQFEVDDGMNMRGVSRYHDITTDWTFVCGTWDGTDNSSGIKLYVNGVPMASGSSVAGYDTAIRNLRIGSSSGRATPYVAFDGLIDEVRIYDKALSEEEVAGLYSEHQQIDLPILESFRINNDDELTESATVILNNSATGDPTHYMASENSDFDVAVWMPYSEAPEYELSAGYGYKTVYFKVKNSAGEQSNQPGLADGIQYLRILNSGFEPREHGFYFANWGIGSCVGMTYAATHFFNRGGYPIKDNADCNLDCGEKCSIPGEHTPLYRYIRRLQNSIVWTSSFNKWILQFKSMSQMSSAQVQEQYEAIVQYLQETDLPRPVLVAEPFPLLGSGHAMLVYKIEDWGAEKRLYWYDPSNPKCDDIYLELRVENDTWSMVPYNDYSLFASLRPYDPYKDAPKVDAVFCPVDIEVVAPSGLVINKVHSDIEYATYIEDDLNGDGLTDKVIIIDYPELGVYRTIVSPELFVDSNDLFDMLSLYSGDTLLFMPSIPVSDIQPGGYKSSTLDTGSVHGVIAANAEGLHGVPVDLYDEDGNAIATTASDENGLYCFVGLDNGMYSVSISTPLGYQAEVETKQVEIRGLPHEVNFELTALEITPSQRGRGYWMHQVNALLSGKGKPQETYDGMCGYMELIRTHFIEHQLNPVDVFAIDLAVDCENRLEALRTVISPKAKPSMEEKAKAHLTALLLNMVSGKIAQWMCISEDSATVSQAITFCDDLIADGDPDNDELVKNIAEMINEGEMIPVGWVDLATVDYAYKQQDMAQAPTGYTLHQNYPNPFNPVTEIRFSIPEALVVRLEVYNILGEKITTLVDRRLEAGEYAIPWDSRDSQGLTVASGIYFYRITVDAWVQTRKMVLLQ